MLTRIFSVVCFVSAAPSIFPFRVASKHTHTHTHTLTHTNTHTHAQRQTKEKQTVPNAFPSRQSGGNDQETDFMQNATLLLLFFLFFFLSSFFLHLRIWHLWSTWARDSISQQFRLWCRFLFSFFFFACCVGNFKSKKKIMDAGSGRAAHLNDGLGPSAFPVIRRRRRRWRRRRRRRRRKSPPPPATSAGATIPTQRTRPFE